LPRSPGASCSQALHRLIHNGRPVHKKNPVKRSAPQPSKPSLKFWFLSNATPRSLKLTITQDGAIQPLVETAISASLHPGIQGVRLGEYGVRLSRGAHYQWLLTLGAGPDNASLYSFAGGAIERADLPQTLSAKLTKAEKSEVPTLYAETGF